MPFECDFAQWKQVGIVKDKVRHISFPTLQTEHLCCSVQERLGSYTRSWLPERSRPTDFSSGQGEETDWTTWAALLWSLVLLSSVLVAYS